MTDHEIIDIYFKVSMRHDHPVMAIAFARAIAAAEREACDIAVNALIGGEPTIDYNSGFENGVMAASVAIRERAAVDAAQQPEVKR